MCFYLHGLYTGTLFCRSGTGKTIDRYSTNPSTIKTCYYSENELLWFTESFIILYEVSDRRRRKTSEQIVIWTWHVLHVYR